MQLLTLLWKLGNERATRHYAMTIPPDRSDSSLSGEEREFSMDCDITRRNFLNTVALGTGTAFLSAVAQRSQGSGRD